MKAFPSISFSLFLSILLAQNVRADNQNRLRQTSSQVKATQEDGFVPIGRGSLGSESYTKEEVKFWMRYLQTDSSMSLPAPSPVVAPVPSTPVTPVAPVPTTPVAPVAPVPTTPVAPVAPVPTTPVAPVAPVPTTPVAPVAPVPTTPVAPVAPVPTTPVAPVAPIPTTPVAPVAPVPTTPVAPVAPVPTTPVAPVAPIPTTPVAPVAPVPTTPVAPVAPVPTTPVAPVAPVPTTPVAPVAPVPTTPVAPVAPVPTTPVAPVAPVPTTPVAPVAPVPTTPVAPVAPVPTTPVAPVAPVPTTPVAPVAPVPTTPVAPVPTTPVAPVPVPAPVPAPLPVPAPSSQPSPVPTSAPTASPSRQPTSVPTSSPSLNPSPSPTVSPTTVPSSEPTPFRTLLELIETDPNLSVFETAVVASGIDDILSTATSLHTVFAPTNAAFLQFDADYLALLVSDPNYALHLFDLIAYHLAVDATYLAGLENLAAADIELRMLAGGSTSFDNQLGDSIRVVSSSPVLSLIVRPDRRASDGVLHNIDSVLLPPSAVLNLYSYIDEAGPFSRFITLIIAADAEQFFQTTQDRTLVAPTDVGIPDARFNFLRDPQNAAINEQVVLYHVLVRLINFETLPVGTTTRIVSWQGEDVRLRRESGAIFFNDQRNRQLGLVFRGIVYEINSLLIPPSISI